MPKRKNTTSHHSSRKAHKNGIKKPLRSAFKLVKARISGIKKKLNDFYSKQTSDELVE